MTIPKTTLIIILIGLAGWLLLGYERCNKEICSSARDTIITIQTDTVFKTLAAVQVDEKKIFVPFTKYRDTCNGKVIDSDTICKEYIAFIDSFYRQRTYSDTSFSDSLLYLKYTAFARGRLDSIRIDHFIRPVKVTVQDKIIYREYARLFLCVDYDWTNNIPTAGAKITYRKWVFSYSRGVTENRLGVGYSILKL